MLMQIPLRIREDFYHIMGGSGDHYRSGFFFFF